MRKFISAFTVGFLNGAAATMTNLSKALEANDEEIMAIGESQRILSDALTDAFIEVCQERGDNPLSCLTWRQVQGYRNSREAISRVFAANRPVPEVDLGGPFLHEVKIDFVRASKDKANLNSLREKISRMG